MLKLPSTLKLVLENKYIPWSSGVEKRELKCVQIFYKYFSIKGKLLPPFLVFAKLKRNTYQNRSTIALAIVE